MNDECIVRRIDSTYGVLGNMHCSPELGEASLPSH